MAESIQTGKLTSIGKMSAYILSPNIGVRLNIPNNTPWSPYLRLGVGLNIIAGDNKIIKINEDYSIVWSSPNIMGSVTLGVDYYFKKMSGLNIGASMNANFVGGGVVPSDMETDAPTSDVKSSVIDTYSLMVNMGYTF